MQSNTNCLRDYVKNVAPGRKSENIWKKEDFNNKHEQGLFNYRYETIEPFGPEEFNEAYLDFITNYVYITNSWDKCPFCYYEEVYGWLLQNWTFFVKIWDVRNKNKIYAPLENIKEDMQVVINKMDEALQLYGE
jgi:hypothetical protein